MICMLKTESVNKSNRKHLNKLKNINFMDWNTQYNTGVK